MRVYTYQRGPYTQLVSYRLIVDRCRRSLVFAGELTREGGRWRAGPHGRRYQNITVQQLIAAGHARIEGDVVRPI